MSKDKIKDFAFRQISNIGFRWTPRAYVANLHHWYHLRQLFASLRIDVVFDVGANEGEFRNFLRRRCGYNGLIISFEPIAAVFEVLQQKAARDANWLVYNYALGKLEGKLQLNVMEDTHFSSFHEPNMGDIVSSDMRNRIVRKELVRLRRLADVIIEERSQHQFQNVFLKIDTQGHDMEVLQGAGEELAKIAVVQIEASVKPIYKGMLTFEESLRCLRQMGFEMTGLFPVTSDRLFRVIEFDCVAVNTELVRKVLS